MPARLDPKVAEAMMLNAGLKPLVPYTNSKTKWKCLCLKCGCNTDPVLNNVLSGKGGCRNCGYKKSANTNRLEVDIVESVMLEAGYQPLEPYKMASAKWKCKHLICGNIVSPQYATIKRGTGGCKYCRYKKSSAARKKYSQEEAFAIAISKDLKPLEAYVKSHAKWKCKCLKCGAIGTPNLKMLLAGQGGCVPCGRTKTADKRRIKPERVGLILKKVNLEQVGVYVKADEPLECRCITCGKIVHPRLSGIISGQGGCEFCANTLRGLNSKKSIEEVDESLKKQSLKRLGNYESVNKKLKCRCLICHEEVFPRISDIQKGIGGCWNCASKKRALSLTFSQEKAFAIMRKANFDPQEPYVMARLRWKSKCLKCNKIVHPNLTDVIAGHGCSYCASYGFQMDKPAYVYLVTHPEFKAHKIGIGNTRKDKSSIDRIHKLTVKGWKIVEKWDFSLGTNASIVEREVFRVLKKEKGITSFLDKKKMPITGGHTETVSADEVSLLELAKIINRIIKEQEK